MSTATSLSPAALVHLFFALPAIVLGALALAARKGTRWHRALGYSWVTMLLATAVSALFVRNFHGANLWGYTWLHLLVPAAFIGIGFGLWEVARGDIARHRRTMRITYGSACVVAGLFTLLPGRYLGQLVWTRLGLLG